jgi:hypothetical protein
LKEAWALIPQALASEPHSIVEPLLLLRRSSECEAGTELQNLTREPVKGSARDTFFNSGPNILRARRRRFSVVVFLNLPGTAGSLNRQGVRCGLNKRIRACSARHHEFYCTVQKDLTDTMAGSERPECFELQRFLIFK